MYFLVQTVYETAKKSEAVVSIVEEDGYSSIFLRTFDYASVMKSRAEGESLLQ